MTPTADTGKLTIQMARFVEIYVATGNATQSYIDAGYKTRGASASACAARLLKTAKVAAAVDAARAKVQEKLEISKEKVLAELAAMAFYDPAELVLPDPSKPGKFLNVESPADIRKLPERVRRCIIGWSYDRNGNFILKLANKQGPLELIGRHLAMWVDRKEVRIGDLTKATDEELDAKIAQAAQQIAESEGRPIDEILAEVRAALTKAAETSKAAVGQVG